MAQSKIGFLLAALIVWGMAPAAAYIPDVGPGHCVAGCDDYSSSDSGSSDSSSSGYSSSAADSAISTAAYNAGTQLGEAISSWVAQAAEAQRQAMVQRTQALKLNAFGNEATAAGNWDEAMTAYEQALQYTPYDLTIQGNLRRARAYKINDQALEYHAQRDWKNAIVYYKQALEIAPEDRTIRKNLTLAERMKSIEKEETLQSRLSEAGRKIQPMVDTLIGDLKPSSGSEMLFAKNLPIEAFRWENPEDTGLQASGKDAGQKVTTKAGEQARSAEFHAENIRKMLRRPAAEPFDAMAESLSEEAGMVFDTPGRYAGSLPKPEIKAEGMGVETLKIPEDRLGDKTLEPILKEWNTVDRDHRAAREKLERVEAREDKTPQDYVDLAIARQEISRIQNQKYYLKLKYDEKLAETKTGNPPAGRASPAPEPVPAEKPKEKNGRNIEIIMVP